MVVGENRTFKGEEDLLTSRGVRVDVLQNEQCIRMMEAFIAEHPELWNEDIGVLKSDRRDSRRSVPALAGLRAFQNILP